MNKRCLVEYNYMLLAKKAISYGGRRVEGVSVSVRFHKLDKSGQEVYLEIPSYKKKGMLPMDPGLSGFLRVSISKEDGILLVPNVERTYMHYAETGENICYRVVKYWFEYEKDEDSYASTMVSKEEFDHFVMTHFDQFDTSNNDVAQCVAYDITYIKEPYIKERYFVGWDARGNPCIANSAKKLTRFYSNVDTKEEAEKRLHEITTQIKYDSKGRMNIKT